MAKRKRLEMPVIEPDSPGTETKSHLTPRARMPIADVAGDTAGRAALEEVAREMTAAETEGRVVKKLPLSEIDTHHLSRDRMVMDEAEMATLIASIAARGQQTPIEVLPLRGGRYGLISGLRRVEALTALDQDKVLAFVRRPEGSQEAYQSMVEENEIRAGLSFYERAHIAKAAVEQGVYPDVRTAVAGLFVHAAPAKRSKITKFVTICEALGDALRFPAAIPEHLGFALAQALEADARLAGRIATKLTRAAPGDAAAERRLLEQALKTPASSARETLAPGLSWQAKAGRAVLSGKALDAGFLEALKAFAISHAKAKG
ncbi:MAG: ParB N-terminal domain-containing protein [Silicimonas sp.]|nr:ParB N-terminal domain-containing protein [Silicimonas sp.]